MKLDLGKDIQFTFRQKTVIINLLTVIKFFCIIYNALFLLLFTIGQIEKGLLRLILNFSVISKINSHSILYLYYLVWLKSILYLAMLNFKI